MNRSKQKGTAAETAVVRYLNDNGFPVAERRTLNGVKDRGDVSGIPGVVVEIKAGKTYAFPAWLKETATETVNARADLGVLVVKPNGVGETRVGEWWAIVPLSTMADLLRDAGYGDAR